MHQAIILKGQDFLKPVASHTKEGTEPNTYSWAHMCVFNFIVTIDYMVVVLLHDTLNQNCSLNPMTDWKQKLFLAKPQLNLFSRVNLLGENCTLRTT